MWWTKCTSLFYKIWSNKYYWNSCLQLGHVLWSANQPSTHVWQNTWRPLQLRRIILLPTSMSSRQTPHRSPTNVSSASNWWNRLIVAGRWQLNISNSSTLKNSSILRFISSKFSGTPVLSYVKRIIMKT